MAYDNLKGLSSDTRKKNEYYGAGYNESDKIRGLYTESQNALKKAQNYGPYTSKYQETLDSLLNKINNQKDFKYDLNGDMLYNQYKDQYQLLGQNAMMDTMGQAAALTGGYGSSYASTAGNQAYQSYLQQLNDKIPDLYNAALNKHNSDLDNLYNKFSVTKQADESDYQRYNDDYNKLLDAYNMWANEYSTQRGFESSDFYNMADFWQNTANTEQSAYENDRNFAEQQRQFNANLAEQRRQYDADMAYKKAAAEEQKRQAGNGDTAIKRDELSKDDTVKSMMKLLDNAKEQFLTKGAMETAWRSTGVRKRYDDVNDYLSDIIESSYDKGEINDEMAYYLLDRYNIK